MGVAFGKEEGTRTTPAELYEAALDAYEMAKLEGYNRVVPGVVLKKGEHAYLFVQGVGYIEPKRLPSTWQGGSRGVSLQSRRASTTESEHTRQRSCTAPRCCRQPTVRHLRRHESALHLRRREAHDRMGSDKLVGFPSMATPARPCSTCQPAEAVGLLYGTEYEEMIEAVIAAVSRAARPTAHASLLSELADNVRDAAGLA